MLKKNTSNFSWKKLESTGKIPSQNSKRFIMKGIVLLLFFAPTYSFAQLSGIGIFKIGNTKAFILEEIKKNTGVELVLYPGMMAEYKAVKHGGYKTESVSGLIDEIAFPESPSLTTKDPLRQDITVNYYSVSGIPITNIQLYFIQDTLVRFACKGSDSLFMALKTKYGEPNAKVVKKTVTCRSAAAGAFNLEEEVTYYNWDSTSTGIKAEYSDGLEYDRKCKKSYVLFFEVLDMAKWIKTQSITFPETKIEKSTLKEF